MFPGFTKLLNWYFSRSAAPYWVILFIDCLIVLISGIYVQLLNFGFTYTETHLVPLLVAYLQYFPCVLVGFRLFHTYAGIIRYSSHTRVEAFLFVPVVAALEQTLR